MAIKNGPGIVTSNLVFAMDPSDTKNSFLGNPTTNLLTYSQDISNSAWNYALFGNWILSTATANATYAPDGTLTATKVNNDGYIRMNRISCSASTTYTISIWFKNVNLVASTVLRIAFGLNGSLVKYSDNVNVSLSGEWNRVSITVTSPASVNQMEIGVDASPSYVSGGSGLYYYVWGAQVEQLPYVTTYLPTTSATATRASGSSLLDISGNARNPVLVNGVTGSGNGMYLDGTNDYMFVNHNGALSFSSGDFTVVVWNKDIANPTSNYNGIITNDNTGDSAWKIVKDATYGYYYARSNVSTVNFGNFVVGKWQMYAFTLGSGTLLTYLDGASTGNYATSVSNPNSYNNIAFGSYRYNDAVTGYYLHNQAIGQTLLYNRALSAAEILQIYNVTKQRYT